jgi:glycosyltransferase involved in cell wall biosynthesis
MNSCQILESPTSAREGRAHRGRLTPKISVLIPTYQYARFLPEAIESVLAQDFGDFELLISDDASTDGSADVIRRYAARDDRIRYFIHEKNIGMVANWNWCLREATGDYVKYLFGDDCLPSRQALGRMAEMLDEEPRAVMAVAARSILDADSLAVEVWNHMGRPGFHDGGETIIRCIQNDRNLIGEPSSVMFRRSAGARGFDPSFRQLVDQEMWFHLLSEGGIVYDPTPLCAFRHHEAQQTVVNRKEQVASAEGLRIVSRYFGYFAQSVGIEPSSLAMRRRLFRRIYYSRKDCRRTPLIIAAENMLLSDLTPQWYFICWVLHRTMKPFENLQRSLGKRLAMPLRAELVPMRSAAAAASVSPRSVA